MKKEKNKKQSLAPFKRLALTSEELEGMSKEKMEVHLRETVTTPMPWWLDWIGRYWKRLLIILAVLIVLSGIGVAISFVVRDENISFVIWITAFAKGFLWFSNWVIIKIIGWSLLALLIVTTIVFLTVKKLIKKDVLAISRYGTNKIKEYILVSEEAGNVIAIQRTNPFGTLIFGKAKAKISDSTWNYIQQNTDLYTHTSISEKARTYRLLTVLPEEYSKEPVVTRIEGKLSLNPLCLIREKDAKELLLENIGKEKQEQNANKEILYNLTLDLNKEKEETSKLAVKLQNVPRSEISRYMKAMVPETRELFFDTYALLKDKKEDLTPFDSLEAKLEDKSERSKRSVKTEDIQDE